MDLSDRVALVTGGAGHIGRTACESLAELGASVAVLDLAGQKLDQAANDLASKYGIKSTALAIDLAEEDEIRNIPQLIDAEFGQLDILINTAALVGTSDLDGWAVDFEEQSSESWRRAQEVNLLAPFIVAQALTPQLRSSGRGSIVNIASIYGIVGPDSKLYEGLDAYNPAAYSASKGGLLQLTRWLSTNLAPEVRVNAISPGGIARGQETEFVDRYAERTPLKRMGTEEDIKGAIAYLASDLSAYVTGQNIVVDGGWTAW